MLFKNFSKMLSWNNIEIVGLYEVKTIRRSNLFKVFVILSLFGITLFQVLIQSNLWPWYDWNLCAMPSSFPYLSTYLYTIIQSLVLIILISDFSDKSRNIFNAVEIFYVRPINNVEYFLGKICGIAFLFIMMNVVILIVAACINIFASETPINVSYYLFYLATMSLPSLIFTIGLTLLVSTIIPYRSLVLLLLVIYYLLILKEPAICHGLFDFQSFSLHNIFSDISGHPNLGEYILHRTIHFFVGCGFIFLSVCYFKRLSDGKSYSLRYILFCSLFFVFALGMISIYEILYIQSKNIRSTYLQVYKNSCYIKSPRIISQNLHYGQDNKIINVRSEMKLQNSSLHDTLHNIFLYLNPSLKVKLVTSIDEKLDFTQQHQVFRINKEVLPNTIINIDVEYEGSIDQNICHILVNDDTYFNTYTDNGLLHFGKKYCFLDETYTLLTPECLWYPTSSEANPFSNIKNNYCDYSLDVKIDNLGKDKFVISQGKKYIRNNKTVRFENDNKLSGLSLCIGKYIERKIEVDSITYCLYFFPDHDFFTNELRLAKDSLTSVLSDFINSYRTFMKMPFLYHQIKIVETPISFASYSSRASIGSSFVQPEMIFLPEKGATLPKMNFKQANYQLEKLYLQRGLKVDERTIQIQNLYQFLIYNFTLEKTYQRKGNIFADVLTLSSSMRSVPNKYYIDPMFQHHVLSIYSKDIVESDYIFNLITKSDYDLKKYLGNLYDGDKLKYSAVHCLSSQSLRSILMDNNLESDLKLETLKLKSKFIRNYILSRISETDFKEFVFDFILKYKYKTIPLETFFKELGDSLHQDMYSTFYEWYNVDQVPKFKISNLRTFLLNKGDVMNYIVNIKALNTSDVDGLLSLKLSDEKLNKQSKHFIIPAKACKELNLFSDFLPREIEVNTNIAENYPLESRYTIYSFENVLAYSGKEGSTDYPDNYFALNPNEVIVDNESEMFHVHKSWINNFLKSADETSIGKYKTFMYWAPPKKWLASINNAFYGDFVKSAYYIKSGTGQNMIDWSIPIERAGKYEIYVYKGINSIIDRYRSSKQYYTIKSANNSKELELDFSENSKEEWILLDRVDALGELKVILTDKGDKDKIIIADAIKLIRTE